MPKTYSLQKHCQVCGRDYRGDHCPREACIKVLKCLSQNHGLLLPLFIALRSCTRAATIKGPVGTTGYLIGDEYMNKAKAIVEMIEKGPVDINGNLEYPENS